MKRLLVALVVIVVSACNPSGGRHTADHKAPILQVIPTERWPELRDDGDLQALLDAAQISLGFFEACPADKTFSFGNEQRSASELAGGIREFIDIVESGDPESRKRRMKETFILLRSTGRDEHGEVFFTGYFEPLLEGRKQSGGDFVYPLYETPDDLMKIDLDAFGVECSRRRLAARIHDNAIVPYWDREAIDFEGKLGSHARALAYLNDPVAGFFLHVQGSGTIVFDDGSRIRAGYATTNGQPYRSIGKILIDEGLVPLEDMSMQAIVDYLEDNPKDLRRILASNPSYVFFRTLPADKGPLGCYERPLTAGRSIATDNRLFPAPVVAWITTTIPATDGPDREYVRFMLNQDTGGSIRGPGRVDIFFGLGDEAGQLAGRTKQYGELFFLLPRSD